MDYVSQYIDAIESGTIVVGKRIKQFYCGIIKPIIPKTLKNMCARAALRAFVEALKAAMLEVTVVPIFSPMTSAMP